jgi:hypothetical protein
MRRISAILALVILVGCVVSTAQAFDPSYSPDIPVDTSPFFPNAQYDQQIPKLNDYLLRSVGQWPLRYHELAAYLNALDGKSDRVRIETHATTHEGRALYNVFISSPENIRNLDKIRADLTAYANPKTSPRDAEAMRGKLPAVAWLGYSIHGDECSGVDAAMTLIYHLVASTDPEIVKLLNRVVIIIDPIQNPDGRERYLSMLETYRGFVPNYNMEALQHRGNWPWGRGNHYWFDMNRDWALVTQPETEGRIATMLKWHPQLVVDAHEMGPDATFLTNPPREPINYNVPESVKKWWKTFGAEQGTALDQYGWPHYSAEWYEAWYPGYGDFWPSFSGTVGLLYEQARVGGAMVKQSGDYLLTYHEAVHHQIVSSMANLTSLSSHRDDILADYRAARVQIVENGRKSGLSFVFPPDVDAVKQATFVNTLLKQGIEVQKTTADLSLSAATDSRGSKVAGVKIPAGSYVVSTAQIQGALAKAILDFDPRFKLSMLEEERRYVQKKDESRMYDVTTWSLPLAYDLTSYATSSPISVSVEPVTSVHVEKGQVVNSGAQAAYIVNMEGEATSCFLVSAFAAGINVYAAERKFSVEGKTFNPGSLVMRVRGNPDSLAEIIKPIAEKCGVHAYGVHTFQASEGASLGADAYHLLESPRVALVTGDGIDFGSVGSIWFALDHELGLPHSLLEVDDLRNGDLSAYNVIIIPSSWGPLGDRLGKGGKENLDTWVNGGGTLICIGGAASWAADSSTGLSQVRLRGQSLEKLDKFAASLKREQASPVVDTMALWYPEKAPAEKKAEKETGLSADDAKELEAFQRKFSPQGAFLRVNLDPESWLSFGMDSSVPALLAGGTVFLSGPPVKTVGRFADDKSLRLSGLLWPEARARIANSAYLTQESHGSGQIILFTDEPYFRAYFWGTRRLLVNAILYGPGMGMGRHESHHSDLRKF